MQDVGAWNDQEQKTFLPIVTKTNLSGLSSIYQNLQIKVKIDHAIFNNNMFGLSWHVYMMQEWYQWKEDVLLFIYKSHINIEINLHI